MLRLMALVISIGLADSVNPSTIAPALYLAGGKHPRREVAEFTLAVFAVYLLGGMLLVLGVGQLVLSLFPRPDREDRFVLETVAGVAMLSAGVFVWGCRRRLSAYGVPAPKAETRSSAILGATITAIELPTAFPYFAVIAAIVGSGLDAARQAVLLVLFNVCFVMPLIGILLTLTLAGHRANRLLASGRRWLEARWPAVLAALALCAGAFVTLLGATGLAGLGHSHFARELRGLHRLLRP